MTTEKQAIKIKDLYQDVTDQIIEALNQSTDWVMPWHQKGLELPQNVLTRKSYSGINILSLWVASWKGQYSSSLWGTYKQWQEKGAQVRKGEKAHQIVFYKDFEKEEENEKTKNIETVRKFVLKASAVFNGAQVDGFDISVEHQTLHNKSNNVDLCQQAEALIARTGARVVHCFTSAFYRPSEDIIGMPEQSCFLARGTRSAQESYYSTLFHELTHWTGHKSRLDRVIPTARFGSEDLCYGRIDCRVRGRFSLCRVLHKPIPKRRPCFLYS